MRIDEMKEADIVKVIIDAGDNMQLPLCIVTIEVNGKVIYDNHT